MHSIDEEGELTTRHLGVVGHYLDEETGEYVTDMISEDGRQMTLVSPEEGRVAGFLHTRVDPESGNLIVSEDSIPDGASLFLDLSNPLIGTREIMTADGDEVMATRDSGIPISEPIRD